MDEAEAAPLDEPFVFLSYAHDESAWAEALAAAIERQGLKIWWDRRLRGGEAFSKEIEHALERAGAVLVVWSEASKRSRWVLDEAGSAADRDILVPVALAGVSPPLGFRQAHTITFSGRSPGRDPAFPSLIEALTAKLGSAAERIEVAPEPRRPRWVWAATAAGIAAAVAGAFIWLPQGEPGKEAASAASSPSTAAPAPKSVAVLPFRALSSGPEDGYFADGVTEEVMNALGTIGDVRVTGRTSAFSFKGRDLPVPEIARKLGVAHVVEGSVRRSGDRMRVSARLVRASDGFQMWQASYDRATADPFDVQSDIAANVAQALQILMDGPARRAMAMRQIINVEAFVAFQKGNELYLRAHADLPLHETLAKANAQFDRAIELAPGTSDAYLLRADLPTHLLWGAAAQAEIPAAMKPIDVADQKRRLNSDLEQAYRTSRTQGRRTQLDFVRSVVSDDWTGLGTKLDATLESHECVDPVWLEEMYAFGQARKIGAYYERLRRCDPFSPDVRRGTAWARLWTDQPDAAIAAAQRMRKEDSENRQLARIELWGMMLLGRYAEAQRLLSNDPGWRGAERQLETLRLNRLTGDTRAADKIHAELAATPGRLDYKLLLAAWSGDRAGAAAWASRLDSAPMGHMSLLWTTLRCMCGAPFPIESTPRFRVRLAQAGFAWPPPTLHRFPRKTW